MSLYLIRRMSSYKVSVPWLKVKGQLLPEKCCKREEFKQEINKVQLHQDTGFSMTHTSTQALTEIMFSLELLFTFLFLFIVDNKCNAF